jgi:hypothetical protein
MKPQSRKQVTTGAGILKSSPHTKIRASPNSVTRLRRYIGELDGARVRVGKRQIDFGPLAEGALAMETDPPDRAANPCTIDNPNPTAAAGFFRGEGGLKSVGEGLRIHPIAVSATDTTM